MLDALTNVLKEGGSVLLDRRGDTRTLERKRSQSDLVSDADRAAEDRILDRLAVLAPSDNVLSEERGWIAGRSDRTWVIDPLDGTTNYAAGVDDFGVIAGLVEGSQPVAGGMYLPALDLLYLAELNRGATRNGQQIHASTTVAPEDAVVDHSLAYVPEIMERQWRTLRALLPRVRAVRCNHSLRYLAYVAEGVYDAFVYHSLGLWDLVGPSVILAEAGATISTLDGGPLDLTPSPDAGSRLYAAIGANPTLKTNLTALFTRGADPPLMP